MSTVKDLSEAKDLIVSITACKTKIIDHALRLLEDEELFPRDLSAVNNTILAVETSLNSEDPEASLKRLLDKYKSDA